ncbi:helix-turn-helix domain-containing protein [Spongiactinospora rosea]|uniref:helix-turn-helix domain-containing protein n=1 Tax=Spongiactinospora rosea TaxID=2248750 RepID=UPI0011C05B99|nr:helix-turn-helix transcriptional regulator [Spongiactinospora rosea]
MSDEDVLGSFYQKIRELHEAAGAPSARDIAKGANCSKTGVNDLLSGKKIPGDDLTLKIIEFLGGEQEEWAPLVAEARAAQARRPRSKAARPRFRDRPLAFRLRAVALVVGTALVIAIVQQVVRMILPDTPPPTTPANSARSVAGALHCALVIRKGAPVYRTADTEGAILKHKNKQDSITYDDRYQDVVNKGETFRAVRTPADPPGYHWMLVRDLQETECGP